MLIFGATIHSGDTLHNQRYSEQKKKSDGKWPKCKNIATLESSKGRAIRIMVGQAK
jgi:hypothetical protein